MESLDHLNSTISDNLSDLVQMINDQNGQPFNPKILIKKTLINVILSMVISQESIIKKEKITLNLNISVK